MAYIPSFACVKRRASPIPSNASFYTPVDLTGLQLIRALAAISSELIAITTTPTVLQWRNSRLLLRKVRVLHSLFEFFKENPPLSAFAVPSTLCFRELYVLLHRSKLLLDYCWQSSRLWVLLLNPKISGYYHDIMQDLHTLLDVLPIHELRLNADVREQMDLLRQQTRRSEPYIDPKEDGLRLKIHSFLDRLMDSDVPGEAELREAFVDRLSIRDARCCQDEIEFLEELLISCDREDDFDIMTVDGVIALTRYCRFLLFGCRPECVLIRNSKTSASSSKRRHGTGEYSTFVNIPKDFCCPISLDLMRDPVIVSSGQTYDRTSIAKWIEEGHNTCPNSGQVLHHNDMVPNRALRSLISTWCSFNGVAFDPPEMGNVGADIVSRLFTSRAAAAIRATVELLVRELSTGSEQAKCTAARELRLLGKATEENRVIIGEAGAIPILVKLLSSTADPLTQENSITAMLNLSIHEENKSRMGMEYGCLRDIVRVLQRGWTTDSRENAAATLLSLSMVHGLKKRICEERGAVAGLVRLLRCGTPRGKKDAAMGLYNISTDRGCCERVADEAGALGTLVGALEEEMVGEEASGTVALLVRNRRVAERVACDKGAMATLVEVMRRSGKAKVRENVAAALAQMCRSGGEGVEEVVSRAPMLGAAVRSLMVTGTQRARRKAAILARMLRKGQERHLGRVPLQMAMYIPVV